MAGQIFSCFMDTDHLYHAIAIRYVERNPVRTGVVKNARDYHWSSVRTHTEKITGSESNRVDSSKFAMDSRHWKKYLRAEKSQMLDELRLKTQQRLVLGNQGFVKRLEKK